MGKSYLFKARTQDAYTVKNLIDLLQNNIKCAYLTVSKDCISMTIMDSPKTICVDLNLYAENFFYFKLRQDEKLFIGLNTHHFYKMIKSIKKQDSIVFFIEKDNPHYLGIKVIPKENSRITTSFIKIQSIQNLDIELPDGYSRSIIVSSSEYQKMCKDMQDINSSISVRSKGYHISFSSDAESIYSRVVSFGEINDDLDDEEEDDSVLEEYLQTFDTENLTRFIKLSGLGNIIHIFPHKELPLLLKSRVGNIGKISIFIKSKEQRDNEKFDNS